MQVAQSQIKRVDVDSFMIPIGSRVIIEPSGLGGKVKTYFIGMERKSYFIVSLAPVIGEDKLAYDFLYKGNKTKVFYTQDGVINGFMSRVLLYTTSPFRHIYFTYPTDAEICNLRQTPRTECHLPCKVQVGDLKLGGMIVNISSGGCGVCLRMPKKEMFEQLQMDSSAGVRFFLVKSMREFTALCEVKNKRLVGDKLTLGMSFKKMDENTLDRVNEFIAWVLSYRI